MQFEGIPGLDEVSDDPQSLAEVDEDEDDTLYIYTITDLAEDRVILDANHPLAGIALRFWIQVANIRPATNEEVSNGRADGQTGLMIGNDEDDYENLDDYLDSASANHPTLH
jgi:FKBP-type peptidyl-prolyl cis-trans isomerase SlyD